MSITIQTAGGAKLVSSEAWVHPGTTQKRILAIMEGANLSWHWPLSAPTLTVDDQSASSVDLSIAAPSSPAIDGYRVYWRAGADFTDPADADGSEFTAGLTVTVPDLAYSTLHYFRAVAYRFLGDLEYHEGELSAAVTATTDALNNVISVVPPMPTLDIVGTFEVPEAQGPIDVAPPMPQLDVAGTHVAPEFSGTIDVAPPMPTLDAAGTAEVPEFNGVIDLTPPMPQVDAAGTHDAPEFSGSVDVTPPVPTLDVAGTAEAPGSAGTIDVTPPMPTLDMAGTAEEPAPVPTITSAYHDPSNCPTIEVVVEISHASGTTGDSIQLQRKIGTGGTWTASGTYSAGSTTLVVSSGLADDTTYYWRAKYTNEAEYSNEYGPVTTNCI